jgi:NADH dehydrogenase FAD-containing subunit
MGNNIVQPKEFLFQKQELKVKKIVIVGASFAGLFLCKKLIKGFNKQGQLNHQIEIVLIDRNSFFEFICAMSHTT